MSKDNSGSITDARERLARTISGEFAREDTLIWRLSVGTADRFLATLNLTPESASALMDGTAVVAHESGNTDHKPEPPADLVERAHVAFAEKYPLTAASSPEMYRLVAAFAAFAAEYATEVVRDMASRFADDVAFWKDRAVNRLAHIDGLKIRVEAAERALAEEREACAKVADTWTPVAWEFNSTFVADRIAAAIRARKGGE